MILNLQELMESTPQAIAVDVNALVLASVTADDVASVADNLCRSGFNPTVTTFWLASKVRTQSLLLIGPATRLLRLAGDRCSRGPTDAESEAYRAAVYAFVSPTSPLLPERTVSDESAEVLATRGGDRGRNLRCVAARSPGSAAVQGWEHDRGSEGVLTLR